MDTIENIKKCRALTRSAFTRVLKLLKEELAAKEMNYDEVQVRLELLSDHTEKLEDLDRKIFEYMIETDLDEESLSAEQLKCEEYKTEFLRIRLLHSRLLSTCNMPIASASNVTVKDQIQYSKQSYKFKLPKIELKKFNGDLKEWLQFWSQFKKIDENPDLDNDDKFSYLIQSIIPNTKASELVNSFPHTGDNYKKVIESLKNRFGKTDMLIEVYVRELLQLVIKNMTKSNENFVVSSLYDKLESHLRALESLNITKTACAPILFPLVESSLPEELLRVWQRYNNSLGSVSKDRLTKLMEFLQGEVDNEERISMAVRGFTFKSEVTKKETKTAVLKENIYEIEKTATATNLLAGKTTTPCIFCDDKHDSFKCYSARKLPLEERQNIAKEKNACYRCLKIGHSFRYCRYNQKCSRCNKRHVLLMCNYKDTSSSSTSTNLASCEQSISEKQNHVDNEIVESISNISIHQDVFLQTLKIKLEHNGKTKIVRAIMDSGSQHSYILKHLANEMQYQPQSEHIIRHGLFGGSTSLAETHYKYEIKVMNLLTSYSCDIDVYDKDVICADIPTIENGIWTRELMKNNIVLTDVNKEKEPICVLIGSDMMAKLFTKNIVELICGVTAIETKLGWTLMGKKINVPCTTLFVMSLYVQESNISDLWKLDVMGIMDPIEQTTRNMHLEEVKDQFRETVTRDVLGRYEVLLPWKENHSPLLCNKDLAFKRLEKTTKRLKEENLYESYSKVLDEWYNEGIIEKISDCEYDIDCYYLPHRHVVKVGSTTPIRPVFDASAHLKYTPSLNQCLETGPNLIELIPTTLLRFREKKIGVIADIRKAFLQISVCPRDRDVLRFLWWDSNDPKKLQIYRHTRVVFGLTSSPFLLGATIEFHLENELSNANTREKKYNIGKLQNSFYVDNCISSVDTENDLILFRETAVNIMLAGGFDLRCWEYSGQYDVPNCRYTSVLGLKWDKADDTLSLKEIPLDPPPTKVTKRFILSASHKIFDCMGAVCPVLLYPKLLLRKLWSKDIDWDKDINEEDELTFLAWYLQLNLLKEVKIQRWLFQTSDEVVSISFHIFVDASQSAYATVVFARVQSKIDTKAQFVQAKSRVAPMKNSTIPRLELLAATIGARLMHSIRKAFQFRYEYETYFWSDSTTVISWIKRNCNWNTFVRNRVQEIHSLTEPEQWRYIPGDENPADLPSRGCDSKHLLKSKWWDGPSWLRLTSECWPDRNYQVNEKEVSNEIMKSKKENTVLTAQNLEIPNDLCWYIKYFSDYGRILRMIAWMTRFIRNCRNQKVSRIHGDLTVPEVEDAELILMKVFQRDTFSGINDHRLSNLEVFTDDNDIIRIKSVIANKRDKYSFRYPIILNPEHELITRLIQYEHKRHHHAGVQTLLNLLRERYWILRGRKAVRNIITKCVTCKRYSTKKLLESAPVLPENRVNEAGVFQVVGLDYAGPLLLKDNKKAWICLFTCAVYRAVHLELVTSLSTETFLQAFRRFVARRGRPKVIYSDNGTNFVSANNLLKNVNWEQIFRYSTVERIQWIHNAPSAAWWGGFWERLIRVVKDILRKLLRTAYLNYEEMATILCDCESIVNSRPITYLSEDPREPGPLSPSMFLQDIRDTELPDLDAIINIPNSMVEKRYQRIQKLRRDLRKRFRSEYLGSLCRHNKSISERRIIKIGDIVLVGNDTDKRLSWPLAKVIQLIPGRDGKVRVARVKTSKGELVRPIQRIYPLEISSEVPTDNTRRSSRVREHKGTDKNQPISSNVTEQRTTKRGRVVKAPLKLSD